MDEKTAKRIENVSDLILSRFGGTGVYESIRKAVERLHLFPAYWVQNINNFTDGKETNIVFRDCKLISHGTTVRQFCHQISSEMEKNLISTESIDGRKLADDEKLTPELNIVKFNWTIPTQSQNSKEEKKK